MSITLAGVVFDAGTTAVREQVEEVGGGDERRVTISGVVEGLSSLDAVNARLDAILAAASAEDYSAALSLRPGRRMWVRRESFNREVSGETLTGSFVLELAAVPPFEESVAETVVDWVIAASGASLTLSTPGNAVALVVLQVTATGDLVAPSFGDGTRTLTYDGTVTAGSELVIDVEKRTVTLDGADVTPYTTGVFPQMSSEGATLVYADDETSSHSASVRVTQRDRWW